jgi:predicted amidohydrolase
MKKSKIGLSIYSFSSNIENNKENILKELEEAALKSIDLLIFPETCITGLINDGNPKDDLNFAISQDDPFIKKILSLCNAYSISTCFGFLEKDKGIIYDSVIYYDHEQKCSFIYRRIDPGWKSRNSDPEIYQEGKSLQLINTSFGKIAILICGDLFNKDIVATLHEKDFDILIHPLVCHDIFNGRKVTEEHWDEEFQYYRDQYRKFNCLTFTINLLGEDLKKRVAFGGAWITSPDGTLIANQRIHEKGVLQYEL